MLSILRKTPILWKLKKVNEKNKIMQNSEQKWKTKEKLKIIINILFYSKNIVHGSFQKMKKN